LVRFGLSVSLILSETLTPLFMGMIENIDNI
jgi:hypothetical protein